MVDEKDNDKKKILDLVKDYYQKYHKEKITRLVIE